MHCRAAIIFQVGARVMTLQSRRLDNLMLAAERLSTARSKRFAVRQLAYSRPSPALTE